jgi:hypothetical protein
MTENAIAMRDPTDAEVAAISARFAAQMPTYDESAWKALKPADRILAAKLCLIGFQPFHFTVMAYKSRRGGVEMTVANLHINLSGREFNARMAMKDRFGGVTVRAMTAQERADWQLEADEVGSVATLWERDPRTGERWEAMQDVGRAGGTRDAGETRQRQDGSNYTAGGNPIARANRVEQSMARAKARVLINGAPLGVPIGTFTGFGGDVIDVEGKVIEEGNAPAEVLGSGSPLVSESTEAPAEAAVGVGADTPKLAAQGAPQGPQAPSVGSVPPAPANQPAVPLIKPAREAIPVVEGDETTRKARGLLANVDYASYEFGGKRGKEAVFHLLSSGFTPEQVVQIVKGASQPDLGW